MSIFFAKTSVARALSGLRDLDKLLARPGSRYVMAYHRVIPAAEARNDAVHDTLWISPESFREQLRWMRTIGEIVEYPTIVNSAEVNQRPWFALTFDDGWRDNYDIALPILQSEGAPAIIFLVSSAVESGALFWTQDVVTKTQRAVAAGRRKLVTQSLAAVSPLVKRADTSPIEAVEQWVEMLKSQTAESRAAQLSDYLGRIEACPEPLQGYLLSWAQAREMSRKQIAFGSHTHTHAILQGLPKDVALQECTMSREIISDQVGRAVDAFCYPNARYSGDEAPLLEQAGYRYGFVIDGRRIQPTSRPYFLPRFLANEVRVREHDFFRLHLLEAPLYAARPHRPVTGGGR